MRMTRVGPLLDVTREDWDRMTHKQAPSHTRAEDREDMQTMTGHESLGTSTFDAEVRMQYDSIMNAEEHFDEDCVKNPEAEEFDAISEHVFSLQYNAGQGQRIVDGTEDEERHPMLLRGKGEDPRKYSHEQAGGRTLYTGGRRS